MINSNRQSTVPSSLNSPGIRQYIDDCISFKNGQSTIRPKCSEIYRDEDVFQALDRCFFSKCYLTEEYSGGIHSLDIDHFLPVNERIELKYEWTNLFPASHDANMMRPRSTPLGGYLNPCDTSDNVENDIMYSIAVMGEEPKFQARDSSNLKAVNTANLLNHIHNGTIGNENSIERTKALRYRIHKKYQIVIHKILEYSTELLNDRNPQTLFDLESEIVSLLSKRSSFTMLIRSMPAVRRLPKHVLEKFD